MLKLFGQPVEGISVLQIFWDEYTGTLLAQVFIRGTNPEASSLEKIFILGPDSIDIICFASVCILRAVLCKIARLEINQRFCEIPLTQKFLHGLGILWLL